MAEIFSIVLPNGEEFDIKDSKALHSDDIADWAKADEKPTYTADEVGAATEKYVDDAIDALPSPMIFKGSLGAGGTIVALPDASADNEGYTYKVITDGTYDTQSAKVGDVFISNGTEWIYIPSADEPSGTVTSVGMTVPTGLSVSGSPITSSGTLTVTMANGYSIPTTAKQTEWDGKQNALTDTQMNAVNSGITADKVATYDGYASEIAKKADAVSGKGMSTNDFTDAYKSAIDNLPTNYAPVDAEKNVQANWNETDETSDAYIKNKPDISGGITSASGNPVILEGLQGGVPFNEIAVMSRNIIDYRYPAGYTYTYGNVTFTVLEDGGINIIVDDTITNDSIFTFANPLIVAESDNYVASVKPSTPFISYQIAKNDWTDGITAVETKTKKLSTGSYGQHRIVISKTAPVGTNITVYPQLELGSTATDYQPPITGKEMQLMVNDTSYSITPDSTPYIVPMNIIQVDGTNIVSIADDSDPTIEACGNLKSAQLDMIYRSIPDVSGFMTKENPTGTGSFSINRLADSDIGANSATFGTNNTASGQNSVAEGEGTIASGKNQHVFGRYNLSDSNSLIIVGNGHYDMGTRYSNNAFSLDKNGNGYFSGDVYAEDPTLPHGQGIPPMIRLARINEIPTSLPANGGIADSAHTIGSVITDESHMDCHAGFDNGVYSAVNWRNAPDGLKDNQGTLIVINYNIVNGYGNNFWTRHIFIPATDNRIFVCMGTYDESEEITVWSAWEQISTTPIKAKWMVALATDENGQGYLFADDLGIPLAVHCATAWNITCAISHNNVYGGWGLVASDFLYHEPYQGIASYLVYYI